nr:hypothetical protein [Streptomyces sp. CHD11]
MTVAVVLFTSHLRLYGHPPPYAVKHARGRGSGGSRPCPAG